MQTARRVLVVEDNVDSALSMKMLLEMFGHTVECAIDGYAALDLAPRWRPDVVFVDIGLPGIDGIEVCRRLKMQPELHKARIFALTAYDNDEWRRRGLEVGFEQYFLKPLSAPFIERLLTSR
jgi:two-component system, sensor histidine kinase